MSYARYWQMLLALSALYAIVIAYGKWRGGA